MQDNKFLVPLSIVLAGVMVSGAIYFGGGSGSGSLTAGAKNSANTSVEVDKVTGNDHILGNPDAPLVIVEYSDIDCPFCKAFHKTMKDVVSSYDGQVAWVYRHFPIAQLHPNAPKKAEATECAAELGGNQAFWQYTDKLIEAAGTAASSAETAELARIAGEIGLDTAAFSSCVDSGKYKEFVQDSIDSAVKAGARGTPYSIIVAKGGKQTVINGAEPLASVKAKIDALLK